jgi:large subunit ribosomal protein L6
VASPIEVALEDSTLTVTRPNDERASRSLHGLTRTLISNMIQASPQATRRSSK